MSASFEQARAAKAALDPQIRDMPAVNGIGVGREGDGHVVRVNLSEPADGVPDEVDGVPVRVQVVGRIVAR
jgi:hypothetical protein